MRVSTLDAILLMLASFRLTHVVVFDRVAAPLRSLVPEDATLSYLVHCYWCAGVWVSAGLVALWGLWPFGGRWVVVVFAVAGGQSFLESLLRRK